MSESTIEVTFLPTWFATPTPLNVTFRPSQRVHITDPNDADKIITKPAVALSTRDEIRRCCIESQKPHEAGR